MLRHNAVLRESNSALKDANDALKELVMSLKNERAMLLEKNKALEAKLTIQRLKQTKIEESSDRMSRAALKLPHAVLLNVFRSLILPWEFYNTSVTAGPRSQWLVSLNTRTACVLVCKHWYAPASQALYSDIVLRRMGQISALARTLRSTAAIYAPDRSRFIRSIYVNECIVLPAAASVVKEDLAFLLHRCTNLRTFALRSCPKFPSRDLGVGLEHRNWFNPTWCWDMDEDAPGNALAGRCATSLEELILVDPHVGYYLNQIYRLLSVATNLRKLVLGPLPEQCDLSETLSALPPGPLSLVTLGELQLPNTDDAFRTYIQETWALPALQRLTLVGCKHFPEGLLEAHGTKLEYLHLLYNGTTSSSSWTSSTSKISALCSSTSSSLTCPYTARSPSSGRPRFASSTCGAQRRSAGSSSSCLSLAGCARCRRSAGSESCRTTTKGCCLRACPFCAILRTSTRTARASGSSQVSTSCRRRGRSWCTACSTRRAMAWCSRRIRGRNPLQTHCIGSATRMRRWKMTTRKEARRGTLRLTRLRMCIVFALHRRTAVSTLGSGTTTGLRTGNCPMKKAKIKKRTRR